MDLPEMPRELAPVPGMPEAFGAEAARLRRLEARLRALFEGEGFAEFVPPLLQRPDLVDAARAPWLARETIVLSDPEGGGPVAVRADMTPLAARFVAARLPGMDEVRLCYAGPVLAAHPVAPDGRREQWQVGAELFGLAREAGDREALVLAARALAAGGFGEAVLVIGHLGILRALVADAPVPLARWAEALGRRSPEDVRALEDEAGLPADTVAGLLEADEARLAALAARSDAPGRAARELLARAGEVAGAVPGVEVRVDAALVPRFLYHDGLVFDGFAPGFGRALLHGGRYDALMAALGRPMRAVGFSLDLWDWLESGGGRE